MNYFLKLINSISLSRIKIYASLWTCCSNMFDYKIVLVVSTWDSKIVLSPFSGMDILTNERSLVANLILFNILWLLRTNILTAAILNCKGIGTFILLLFAPICVLNYLLFQIKLLNWLSYLFTFALVSHLFWISVFLPFPSLVFQWEAGSRSWEMKQSS